MSTISMSPLCEEDLEFLRKLRNDVRGWLFTKTIITRKQQRDWYFNTYSTDSSWLIFIGHNEEGMPIGYGQIRKHTDESYELGVAVRPEYWGQGYGTGIVEWLLLYTVLNLKSRNVWLQVYADNVRAVNLYKSAGFKTISDLGNGKLRMELQ